MEPVFRLGVWTLAVVVGIALWACLSGLGAPLAALPVVLGLGVIVQLDGLGRGDFVGLISPFFPITMSLLHWCWQRWQRRFPVPASGVVIGLQASNEQLGQVFHP